MFIFFYFFNVINAESLNGQDGLRSHYLNDANVTLYQLSYSPGWGQLGIEPRTSRKFDTLSLKQSITKVIFTQSENYTTKLLPRMLVSFVNIKFKQINVFNF